MEPDVAQTANPKADLSGNEEANGVRSESSANTLAQTSETISPHTLSDLATEADALGFTPYVQAISDFLTHEETRPPLTLSVEGSWGCGKSSFMKQLQREVKKKGAKTVWFNAWRYDKEESMMGAFALAFTGELGRALTLKKRVFAYCKLQKQRFEGRKFWLMLLGRVSAILVLLYFAHYIVFHTPAKQIFADDPLIKLVLGLGVPGSVLVGLIILKKIYTTTGNPLKVSLTKFITDPRYQDRISFVEGFHSDFQWIVDSYAPNQRVFVFVDDLDRCDVNKSADMMQALNLLISDSLKIVYVIGLDRKKIAAGLGAKYASVIPYLYASSDPHPNPDHTANGLEFGYSYIEKFIQLPFQVPEVAGKNLKLFFDRINGAELPDQPQRSAEYQQVIVETGVDSERVRSAVELVAGALDYNPRRIKQFINMFRLKALLASRTGLFSQSEGTVALTFSQLAKLVAIELRWPLLLSDAAQDVDLLTKLQSSKPAQELSGGEAYWLSKTKLMELLSTGIAPGPQAGIVSPNLPNPQHSEDCALTQGLVRRYLQVSPVTTYESAKAATSSSAADLSGRWHSPERYYGRATSA